MGSVASERWCKRVLESNRQNEALGNQSHPLKRAKKTGARRGGRGRREKTALGDQLFILATLRRTDGLGQLPSTLAGTERTRSKLLLFVVG